MSEEVNDLIAFDKYQSQASTTAMYPGRDSLIGLCYCALGLGEVGEIQGKVKKILRDANGIVTDETRQKIAGELGDALWYISQMAFEIHMPLSLIAKQNLEKLADRKARGVIQGSGDNR